MGVLLHSFVNISKESNVSLCASSHALERLKTRDKTIDAWLTVMSQPTHCMFLIRATSGFARYCGATRNRSKK